MSESTIVLPVTVDDRAALAELKKVQKELGNAGMESAKLNKQIEDAMKNMAAKTGKAYGDMGLSLQGFKNKFAELNAVAGAASAAFGFAKQAVELANFSAEFRRLQAAIPVDRMMRMREETKGTVSDFDLLTRAAKEMKLSATAGMDEQALALKRGLADWSNFIDAAKASIGGLISTAIVAVVDLSHAIANAISDGDERVARARAGRLAAQKSYDASVAAFDASAAKSKVFTDEMDVMKQQGAADRLGIGKVFPNGVDAFVKGYKPPKPRRGGGSRGDGGDAWGDLLRPSAPNAGDAVVGGIRSGMDTLGAWSQSANGVGGAVSGFGSAISGIGVGLGSGVDAAAQGLRDRLAENQKFIDSLQDQSKALGATYTSVTQMLAGGLAASVEAAISGHENIGKAALKGAAASLKAIAIESSVKALFATAEGIFGFGPGFAAAGVYAATAAAAGAGAAALGYAAGEIYGGSGSSGAKTSGGFSSGTSPRDNTPSQGMQDRAPVNIYINGFIGDRRQLTEMIVSEMNKVQSTSSRGVVTRVQPAVASK